MAVHVGDKLKNRYRIEESLGRGGMADVYKVWDEERSTYLALKLLRDDLAQDPVFMRRFRREAHNLAQLQHPNIVRFYGLEEDDLKAFILMEYIEGPTLREEIRRAGSGGMSQERIQSVMKDVCSALHYAHAKGLVHCDIKSGNILIDASGKAYLTDFGIARGMDMATSTMVGIGTPAYTAPELIKGQDPTPQTDIYALGIVLYEMLTGGERPFTGERATITGTTADKVRWEHLKMTPAPISQFNPHVNSNLQAIIEHCLQKQSKERFQSIEGLMASLDDLAKGKDVNIKKQEEQEEKYFKQDLKAREEDNDRVKEDFSDNKNNKARKGKEKNRAGFAFIIAILAIAFLIVVPVTINNRNVHATQTVQAMATKNVRTTMNAESTATIMSRMTLNDLQPISLSNVNKLREIYRFTVSDGGIQDIQFNGDERTIWISLAEEPSRIFQYDYVNNSYSAEKTIEVKDGNEIIGFSYEKQLYATLYKTKNSGLTQDWKFKVWSLENGTNICNSPELSSFLFSNSSSIHLINSGEYIITEERELLDNYDMNTKTYISLWSIGECKKLDVLTYDGLTTKGEWLFSTGDSLIWNSYASHDMHFVTVQNDKFVDHNNILSLDMGQEIKTAIIGNSNLIIVVYKDKIEIRELDTMSIVDSFEIRDSISSIIPDLSGKFLIAGTENGEIILFGITPN